MSPADPVELHLEECEDSQATTAAFLPLMDLIGEKGLKGCT